MNETYNPAQQAESEANVAEELAEETTAPDATSKEVIIEVENPNKEEMQTICKDIKADYNFDVDTKAVNFNFKKSKDKATGIETIRKPVLLAIPYPSVDGIVAILQNEDGEGVKREGPNKGLELLMEAVESIVNTAARELLYEDTTLSAATFPVEKLDWNFIANIPKVARRGGGIPKEIWDGFAADYIEVMPEATNKTIEACTNAAKLLQSKLGAVRTNEPVLELLMSQLAIYAEHSPNIEEYVDCVEFLVAKGEGFLKTTPEELLANL